MRIIAGSLGGRNFDAPKGKTTHPMSERVRGALFNMLGDLSGKRVLDCYAGSGALGFEAISRGASFVQAIEIDKRAHNLIEQNAKKLRLGRQFKATRANCASWAANNQDARFDVILADPPFDQVNPESINLLTPLLAKAGLVVLSLPRGRSLPYINDLKAVREKSYGDASLAFFVRN